MLSENQEGVFILFMFSFFLGELEKCLEDPEKLGSLFVKHVSANVPAKSTAATDQHV